jgi:hypothetical protein
MHTGNFLIGRWDDGLAENRHRADGRFDLFFNGTYPRFGAGYPRKKLENIGELVSHVNPRAIGNLLEASSQLD